MAKLEKLIGQTLDGKYLLDKLLGQGGMGAVFLATHLGTKRPVALKVIAPQFMANEEVGERFRREAEAAGRLRHPNVVNVTDFGVTNLGNEQLAYLVMEYLDGSSLGDMLKEKGRLPLHFVVDIVEQICLAIGNAHLQGIIHRDLKPDNIWLQPDGRGGYLVKVLDFGLAKLRDVAPTEEAQHQMRQEAGPIQSRALSDRDRETVGAQHTTQQGHSSSNLLEARTQIQALDTTSLEAQTQIQPQAPTAIEAATLIQPSAVGEIEQATLIQPSPGEQMDTLLQMADDEESATRIQIAPDTAAGISSSGNSASSRSSGSGESRRPATAGDSSSVTSSSAVELTRIGSILGTPLYMSPEQCRSEPLDPRSDIYSLGVIVYQMLAGSPPFSGSMTELMAKHCDQAPTPLAEKRQSIPESVSKLVMSALAKSPEDRPALAEVFANALRATAENEADLLRQAKATYYNSQRTFFVLSLCIYVPFAALSLSLSLGLNRFLSQSSMVLAGFYLLLFLLILFATKLSAAAFALAIKEQRLMTSGKIELKPVLRAFGKRLPQLFSTIVLAYLKTLLGLIQLVMPGARTYLDNLFFPAVVALEKEQGLTALARSRYLVNPLRPLARSLVIRDFGISLLSLIAFPCITVLMATIFSGVRINAWAAMKSPSIRNFIVGYCWFLLIILHTVYSAVPTAMLYFKARQATGETLDLQSTDELSQVEAEKRPNRIGKATIAWLVIPLALLAFMIYSSVIGLTGAGITLIEAVRDGRQQAVTEKLAAGANPNSTRMGGVSVLMYAARQGNATVVKELLKAGANIEQRDEDGQTALIYAAIDNRVEALKALLEAGAEVNARDREGKTALLSAAYGGRLETVKALLTGNPDVNLKDNQGKTALQYAQEEGYTEIAQSLQAAGANP